MTDTTNLQATLGDIAEDIADERHHRTLAGDYGPIDAGGYADRMLDAVREALASEASLESVLREAVKGDLHLERETDRKYPEWHVWIDETFAGTGPTIRDAIIAAVRGAKGGE